MRFSFVVPQEEPLPTAWTLLERAWPEGTDAQRRHVFDHDGFTVDGRITRNPDRELTPGDSVLVQVPPGEEPFGLPDASDLARGNGWVVVEKTIGMPGNLDRDDPMNPVLFLADMLGFDRDTFEPVWPVPANMGGPWLIGLTPDDADSLRSRIGAGEVMNTWSAITPAPAVPRGTFVHAGVRVQYGCARIQDGLAEIQLTPEFAELSDLDPVKFLLDLLAAQNIPVVGDRDRGGIMAAGGCRLRLTALYDAAGDLAHSWSTSQTWWPRGLTAPKVESPDAIDVPSNFPTLQVSRKTLEIMTETGHPWVLADKDTGKRDHFKPGTIVQLKSPEGRLGPLALIEGPDKLAARFFSRNVDDGRHFRDEIEIRVDEAIARRAHLQAGLAHTDLFRLIHSEADGLPGLELDRVGPVLRATVTGATSKAFRTIVYNSIADFDPDLIILEVEHMRDIREGKKLPQARIVRGRTQYITPGQRLIGREDDLRYWLEPWEGIDTGFFADQRDNRRRLRALAKPGQRWLNLFCHTGAFSVALVHEGASVVSNDLSKRYLDWLDENLELNQLDLTQNTNVADDARNYLDQTDELFDGIIVDPPTAAQGDGFWSVRKGYAALLEQCFRVLKPGGVMLVCRNDRKRSERLDDLITEAAAAQKRKIKTIENAPPASDYPDLPGFPEGDSFEGRLVFTR